MKTPEQIKQKRDELLAEVKVLPRTAEESNVAQHKALWNQINTLSWVLDEKQGI